MAYDPQRDRPRHRSDPHQASVVDSLLDTEIDPPPQPIQEPAAAPGSGATPEPASGWTDRLLYSAGMSTLLSAAAALVALWLLWRHRRHRRR